MFQIGDRVMVRHHTTDEKAQYPFGWTPLMGTLEGNTYRVCKVNADHCVIEDDGSGYMLAFKWALMYDSLQLAYDQF